MTFPFEWLTRKNKLNALYQIALTTQELTVALQDQIQTLTARVATLEGAVTTLTDAVDSEQLQVQAVLDLLTQDNPDITAAITKLETVAANLGAVTADVESTVTPAPAPEPEPPVA
jgi:chromosome segregation ATPase